VPLLPASTGAVPSTATFPLTAAPHVLAVDNASDGTVVEHDADVDGSPITMAEYVPNCAVVIASHAEADATVTVNPSAAACCASTLDEPPFTDVDKISTEPDSEAWAGADPTATPATTAAATPAPTTEAGATTVEAPSAGTASNTSPRRNRRPAHEPHKVALPHVRDADPASDRHERITDPSPRRNRTRPATRQPHVRESAAGDRSIKNSPLAARCQNSHMEGNWMPHQAIRKNVFRIFNFL
jgi:hypothetical protein